MNDLIRFVKHPIEFFHRLNEITTDKKYSYKEIISFINEKKEIDICRILINYHSQRQYVYDSIEIITPYFPELKFEINSLIEFFKMCFHAHYDNSELIIELQKHQPQLIHEVLKKLIDINDEFVVGYITQIYFNLGIVDPMAINREIENQIFRHKGYVLEGLLLAMANINSHNGDKVLIDGTLSIFKKLIANKDLNVNSTITYGLRHFVNDYQAAEQILLDLVSVKEIDVLYQISRILVYNYESLYQKDWFENVLYSFSEISRKDESIIHNLDRLFRDLLIKYQDLQIFISFLKLWLQNIEIDKLDKKIIDLWPLSMREVISNEDKLSYFILDMFNADNYYCHLFIAALLNRSDENMEISFHKSRIKELEYEDLLYVVKKVMGYVRSQYHIYSLLNSIILRYENDEEVIDMICSFYIYYLAKDYLTTIIGLIENTIHDDVCQNVLLFSKLRGVLDYLKQIKINYESLEVLNELDFSSQKMYQYALEEKRQYVELDKKLEKESLLTQMGIGHTPLMFGKGWFSYIKDDYTRITNLQLYSSSYEIPKSDIVSPVDAAFSKFKFRLDNRGEK